MLSTIKWIISGAVFCAVSASAQIIPSPSLDVSQSQTTPPDTQSKTQKSHPKTPAGEGMDAYFKRLENDAKSAEQCETETAPRSKDDTAPVA